MVASPVRLAAEATALEKRLRTNHCAVEDHRDPRAACAVAYQLGGAKAVLWMATARYNLGL